MLKFLHQVASCYITTLCFWTSMPTIPISWSYSGAYVWKWVTLTPWHALFAWLEEGGPECGAVTPALGQDHTQTVQRDLFISEASTERGFCDLQKSSIQCFSDVSVSWGKLTSLIAHFFGTLSSLSLRKHVSLYQGFFVVEQKAKLQVSSCKDNEQTAIFKSFSPSAPAVQWEQLSPWLTVMLQGTEKLKSNVSSPK